MGPECILVDVGYDNRFVLLVDRCRLDLCVLVGYWNMDGLAQDVPVLKAHIIQTLAWSITELLGDWLIHTAISGLKKVFFCFELGAFCHIRYHQILNFFPRLKTEDLLLVLTPDIFFYLLMRSGHA